MKNNNFFNIKNIIRFNLIYIIFFLFPILMFLIIYPSLLNYSIDTILFVLMWVNYLICLPISFLLKLINNLLPIKIDSLAKICIEYLVIYILGMVQYYYVWYIIKKLYIKYKH